MAMLLVLQQLIVTTLALASDSWQHWKHPQQMQLHLPPPTPFHLADFRQTIYASQSDVGATDSLGMCRQYPRCLCNSNGAVLGVVECRSTDITTLDQFFRQTKMYSLLLEHNGLGRIEDNSFQHSRLWRLSITYNELREVPDLAFHGLQRYLRQLSLRGNHLTRFPHSAVKQLTFLTRLDLSDNYIQTISRDDFSGVANSLQELLLNDNNLYELKGALFEGLSQLTHIHLSGNRITRVDERAFSGTALLLSINLQNNLLNQVPAGVIHREHVTTVLLAGNQIMNTSSESSKINEISKLELLDLSGNHMTQFISTSLAVKGQIGTLRLSRNDLNHISDLYFDGWLIESLIMSHCKIKHIANESFSELAPSLKMLDLSYNELHILPWKFLKKCHKLETLILNNNPDLKIIMNNLLFLTRIKHLNLLLTPFTFGNTSKSNVSLGLASVSLSLQDSLKKQSIHNLGQNVQFISLAHSKLRYIDDEVFLNCPSLKGLDLSFNSIEGFSADSMIMLSKTLEFLRVHQGFTDKTFPSKAIGKLVNLKSLDFSGNEIQSLDVSTFESMRQIKFINLRWNKLEKIDTGLFHSRHNPYLQTIDISFNRIVSVSRNSFKSMKNMRSIVLSDNKISTLAANSFDDLSAITIIDLSNNVIVNLDSGVFRNIPYLARIDLSFNKLTSLNMDSFDQVGALETLQVDFHHNSLTSLQMEKQWKSYFAFESLDLSYNQIQSINDSFFDGIRETLLVIDLSNNIIDNLTRSVFENMVSLQKMDLSFNNISRVDVDLFQDCHNLVLLNLSHNRITHMQSDFLQDHIKLKVLDLTANFLTNLPFNFARLTSLSHLYLSKNNFTAIPREILGMLGSSLIMFQFSFNRVNRIKTEDFYFLKNLRYLDISENQLALIDGEAFRSLTDLQLLDLSNNPISGHNLIACLSHLDKLEHLRISKMSLIYFPELHSRYLQYLDISHNSLSGFRSDSLINQTRLLHLDVSSNSIHNIDSLSIFNSLRHLNLAYNPIQNITSKVLERLVHLESLNLSGISTEIIQDFKLGTMASLRQVHVTLHSRNATGALEQLLNGSNTLTAVSISLNHSPKQQLHLSNRLCSFSFRAEHSADIQQSSSAALTLPARLFQNNSCQNVHIKLEDASVLRLEDDLFSTLNSSDVYLEMTGDTINTKQAEYIASLQQFSLKAANISCVCNEISWIGQWLREWMLVNCAIAARTEQCSGVITHFRHSTCRDGRNLASAINSLQCNDARQQTSFSLVLIAVLVYITSGRL